MENQKFTLEEFIEALKDINLVNPYHFKLENAGHGEFPDSYRITDRGAERLKEDLILNFKNKKKVESVK